MSKAVDDLAGSMAFAVLMGTSRAVYGKYGEKLDLNRFMAGSALLCVAAYLCIALMALAGDLGCSGGPTLVGMVSSALGDNLKRGILAGIIFPILLLAGLWLSGRARKSAVEGRRWQIDLLLLTATKAP
ncbi:MAG: hypothetical protein HDT35_06270 [Clostridiales bacterium]|nr:hypothetical protein [Clostridiales bacterium]